VSTDSALGTRTIIVHQAGPSYFNVSVGDRHVESLTADECLWVVAQLLMNKKLDYALRTISEITEEAIRHNMPALRPFERLLTGGSK
jgi:hypothetical protein